MTDSIIIRGHPKPSAEDAPLPDTMDALFLFPRKVIASRPCRHVGAALAVLQHAGLDHDDRPQTLPGWRIAIRTGVGIEGGVGLLGMFDRQAQAVDAALKIDTLLDWSGAIEAWRCGRFDALFDQIRGDYVAAVTHAGGRMVDSAVVVAEEAKLAEHFGTRRTQHAS